MSRRPIDEYEDNYSNYPIVKKPKQCEEYDSVSYDKPNVRCSSSQIFEDIKQLFETTCTEIEQSIDARNFEIMESLTEQKILLKELKPIDVAAPLVDFIFPLKTELDLQMLNDQITKENRKSYISTIASYLRSNIQKNFNSILSNDIIISFNLDGTHGKKKLKDYKEFFDILLAAIESLMPDCNPEEELRKAFQTMKKRHYKRICLIRKNEND